MPRYTVAHSYSSYRDGQGFGPWPAGQVVDLAEADAAWVNRDSPGALAPGAPPEVVEDPPAARQQPPARDRQHRGGRARAT